MTGRRDGWRDGIWESDLPPVARLVALAYADHSGPLGSAVWVTHRRLMARTGLAKNSVTAARRVLCERGWLVVVEAARGSRAARYMLVVPPVCVAA